MEIKNPTAPFNVTLQIPASVIALTKAPLRFLHGRPVGDLERWQSLQGGGAEKVLIRTTPILPSVRKIFVYAGLTPPEALPIQNPVTGTPADWSTTTDAIVNFMIDQTNRQMSLKQTNEAQHQNEKLLHLLLIALRIGNIDLAMLLFSALESRQATEMTKILTQKLVEAQENRRTLTGQMAGNDKDSQKNLAKTQAGVQEVNDQISLLTSFIRDVNEQKNRTLEFANNFLINEHQTTMSIVRGMKG